jgi:hypothetical protein
VRQSFKGNAYAQKGFLRKKYFILVTMGLFMIRIRVRALRSNFQAIHFLGANLDIPTSFGFSR